MIRILIFSWLFLLVSFVIGQSDPYYSFIENKGQWPDQVQFKCKLTSGSLYLEESRLVYDFVDFQEYRSLHANPQFDQILAESNPQIRGHVYQVSFLNSNDNKTFFSDSKLERYNNYFLGNDQKKWASDCSLFAKVAYRDLYEGIDAIFYSTDFLLKYDFIVKAKADPSKIKLEYEGMNNVWLDHGRLKIDLEVNQIIEQKPFAYQIINDVQVPVKCNYVLKNNVLSFEFPDSYNSNYELIIDPELIFSTYSGSTSDNFGYTATYDSDGFLYSGSSVFGNGYPNTTGFYQENWAGGDGSGTLAGTDIAITKYDTTGTFMIYSTYLGGSSDELPHSLIVDEDDQLYVYGTTSSADYPVTNNAYSSDFNGGTSFAPSGVGVDYINGSDILVSQLSADGTDLLASTFVGGTGNDGVNTATALKFNYADDMRGEILIDQNGDILVASCTYSNDFPVVNGYQNSIGGDQDACLFKMSPNLSSMIWSSYFGGSGADAAYSLDIDSNNDIYVGGGTESTNLFISAGAYQGNNFGGQSDGFIFKINSDGSVIPFSTYYGSNAYDQVYFVEIDDEDDVYIYGQTNIGGSTLIENADYGTPNSGMLISKFNPQLSTRLWSTVFGTGSGLPNLSPTAFLVDDCQRLYMAGWGGSTNVNSTGGDADFVTGMEVTDDAYQPTTTGSDFYLLVLDSDANDIIYGSFFGGNTSAEHVDGGTSRFSPDGTVYQSVCAGCGSNDDFPIYPANAHSDTNNSTNCNNGVFKIKFDIPLVSSDYIYIQRCVDELVSFVNQSQSADEFEWDFGDGSDVSNEVNPTHIYEETGSYEVQLVAFNPNCEVSDTITYIIEIIQPLSLDLGVLEACEDGTVVLGPDDVDPEYDYQWLENELILNNEDPNPEISPTEADDFTLLVSHDGCVDSLFQSVDLVELDLIVPDDIVICDDDFVDISAITEDNAELIWSDLNDFSSMLNDSFDDWDISPFVDEEQTFYAQATIGDCEKMDEITVTLLASQAEIEADITACANDTIVISVIDPNPILDYSWSPSTQIISGQNTPEITVVVTEMMTYTVTVQLNPECVVTDEIDIFVSGVDANQIQATATPPIIYTGDSSQLQANPPELDYTWTPDQSLNNSFIDNPLASPLESTWYQVDIADGECIYKDSVFVQVVDFICGNPTVYLPNAFTPNDNSENEILFIRGNNLTEVHLVVFDRWGEKIFETFDQEMGWDGTYKGEALDPAVFVYHMNVVCGDGQRYFEKGNVTLIR